MPREKELSKFQLKIGQRIHCADRMEDGAGNKPEINKNGLEKLFVIEYNIIQPS